MIKVSESLRPLFIRRLFFLALGVLVFTSGNLWAVTDGHEQIPLLEKSIQIALAHNKKSSKPKKPGKIIFSVKQKYYLVQLKNEQLGIAREVKKHFEMAATKADEKMESGEGEVTQSDITMLKLGLAGTLHDISKYESEAKVAILRLGELMGKNFSTNSVLAEPDLGGLEFPHKNLGEYRHSKNGIKKTVPLQEAFIKVEEMREQLSLAKKNRKITRILMVTEVANYDFGIGDEEEIFQALIIYTRVLAGYFESIYNYNLAVLTLNKIAEG